VSLRRRVVDWSLAAVLLIVPALILRSSLKEPEETSKLDQAILRVSSPLQAGISWIVDGVGSMWSRYVSLIDVEDENRELRAENERLRKELAIETRRAIDAASLEKMLDLKAETPADTAAARVIATSTSPHYRVVRIRIDRGAPQVAERFPVITSDGLVGKVIRVYGGHADVMLVTDPGMEVPVMIKRTGLIGMVRGQGDPDSYDCKFEWQKPSDMPGGEAAIEEGDIVQTSGNSADFPAGITVGVVTKVIEKDYGMDQEAVVEPSVSFSHLRAVMVILAPPPPADPDADKKRKPDSAFGVKPF
jgi:rod shape-determining protein MreC